MQFIKLFALILTLIFPSLSWSADKITKNEYPYYLSVMAVFKNEGPYLKEWIEYHRLVGVEHFYLYNNNSTDNYLEVLAPYISTNIVELTDWPTTRTTPFENQVEALNHCLATKCRGSTFWLAHIDLDEFIVPVEKSDLISFLSEFDEQTHVGGIKMNWQNYGTSWLPSIPKDKLMIESLILKGPSDFNGVNHDGLYSNFVVKLIVKPHTIDYHTVHQVNYKSGFFSLPIGNLRGVEVYQPIKIDQIRLNHYMTKATDWLHQVKLPRLEIYFNSYAGYPKNTTLRYKEGLNELNQVEDRIMDKFIPQLRVRMGLDSPSSELLTTGTEN